MLWGPRQVGKTTLLDQLPLRSRLFLDDLTLRRRAQEDPGLTLDGLELPALIDEAQYAPNLFPEIKLRIDRSRRTRARAPAESGARREPLYYLTGSNRLQLDENVKESLAGRSHLYTLHGLSVREILRFAPATPLKLILFRGGFPELHASPTLRPVGYLNDYIATFVEKDIALSAGISKLDEFRTVLQLLAARTGQFLNVSEVATAAGVDGKTAHAWIGYLERSAILQRVAPYATNLSKRIVKMPKLFFYDSGLSARLQGHNAEDTLWTSPQAGALFESLVFSELVKTRDNHLLDWSLHVWRTKEQHEVDFILLRGGRPTFIEAKLAIHGARPFALDPEARKVFPPPHDKLVVTAGGEVLRLDRETTAVPVGELGSYLLAQQNH
jgi:predicted AAA+ superfamily ATPase